ncbi:hydrogenase maturation nickel metallochaperone HypA [Thermoproteota archaeon]
MHELSVVEKEVQKLKSKINGKTVSKVTFSLGKLAHGTPDSIRAAFELASEKCGLAKVECEIVTVDPKAKCLSCGEIVSISELVDFSCPECGSKSSELIAGQECFIDSVEVQD